MSTDLAQARADLVSLDADTATLERNVSAQNTELDKVRREARAGRADFADVVTQQTRRDAAAGMLQQHLEDVAGQRALVDELEGAAVESVAVLELRSAWASMLKTDEDYTSVSYAAEKRLNSDLDKLRTLATQHAQAVADVSRLMREAAIRGSGYDGRTVGDYLRQQRSGSMDKGERDAQAQAISSALESFADLATPEDGAAVVSLVRRAADQTAPILQPDGVPMVARAWEAHSAR